VHARNIFGQGARIVVPAEKTFWAGTTIVASGTKISFTGTTILASSAKIVGSLARIVALLQVLAAGCGAASSPRPAIDTSIPARSSSAASSATPPPRAIPRAPAPDPSIVASALAKIRGLGTAADADPSASVQALHAAGREAVPLLVAQLSVVDPEAFDDRAMHVVWCIRALRSLTGQDFYFHTGLPLSPRSAAHLDAKEPMGFYAYWMSHGLLYVAPPDVQRKVIEAWKGWAQARTDKFDVQPFQPYGDWFF
jgi:hypothetical protein